MSSLEEILRDECPHLQKLCKLAGIIPDPTIPIKIGANLYLFYATRAQHYQRWLYVTGGEHYITNYECKNTERFAFGV